MDGLIFSKTNAGVEELQTRQMRLHPRARSLLIMVDGKQPVFELCSKFPEPQVMQEHLMQLQEAGLIHVPEVVEPEPVPGAHVTPFSEPQTEVPADENSRLMALYRIYTDTINTCFANRPGPYQKKLSQAVRIGDYIALGNEIITALNKSERVEIAVNFKMQVRPLLK